MTEELLVRLGTMLDDAERLRDAVEYARAEELLVEALELAAEEWGADSVPVAQIRNDLGILLKAAGHYDAARDHYLEALAVYHAQDNADADAIATLHHNLAGIELVREDVPAAADWGRQGLAIRRELLGDDHPSVLADEGNLAPILVTLGAYDEAEVLLTRLHEQYVERLGPDDYEVAVTLTNLGGLAAHREDWGTARDHLRDAVSIKSALFGPDHPELLKTLVNLAVVADRLDPAEAAEARSQALRIARHHLDPDHPLRRTIEGPPDD